MHDKIDKMYIVRYYSVKHCLCDKLINDQWLSRLIDSTLISK